MYSDLQWAIHRLYLDDYFQCTVSPMEIKYKPTGQKILFRGFDDPLKITSISVDKGVLCFVWIEEAYELQNEDDFNKLDLSIRGEVPDGYFKQITLTFNPWSDTHWLKRRFFDVQKDNIFAKTTTWECNEWLDEADREIFLDMKANNPDRYRVEGLGDWGITEGQIFKNLEIREISDEEIAQFDEIYNGVDWGTSPDPYAFVRCALEKDVLYIFDEYTVKNASNKSTAEWIIAHGYDDRIITCDRNEKKSVNDYKDLGLPARAAQKGPGSREYSYKWLTSLKKIVIDPVRCKVGTGEFSAYHHEKDKQGNFIPGYPDGEDHVIDATRYALEDKWKRRGNVA